MELIEGMKFDRGYISPYFMNTTKGYSEMYELFRIAFKNTHQCFFCIKIMKIEENLKNFVVQC